MNRAFRIPLLSLLTFGLAASHSTAAMPDGAQGGWADSVVTVAQGKRLSGYPVAPLRSDPQSAVGVAEATQREGTFFSLGLGGNIVLAFDNAVCDATGPDLAVVEATRRARYISETAQVDVSPDGTNWVPAARALQKSGEIELPDAVLTRFVRIVDTTAGRVRNLDGFDVDGVRALHPTGPCQAGSDGDDPSLAEAPAKNAENTAMGVTGPAVGGAGASTQGAVQGIFDDQRTCSSRRVIRIRLRVPKRLGSRLKSARISASKGVKVSTVRFRRGRYRATVDLRGLKKSRYRLTVGMVGRNGNRAKDSRRYRVCAPR